MARKQHKKRKQQKGGSILEDVLKLKFFKPSYLIK